MSSPFLTEAAQAIWQAKYALREPVAEHSISDSWQRVASALAAVEQDRQHWRQQFLDLLHGFRFLPGGRILAGAGSGRHVTLFNCFVMGRIDDSMEGIFEALKQGAITMQQGGGVGYDFSTLRPAGTPALSGGTIASGPVPFMRIWDVMCSTLLSTGTRRGAMMATLRCDHPDIEAFIAAKADSRELRNFNLSVLVSDALIEAVQQDADWPLVFPQSSLGHYQPTQQRVMRHWGDEQEAVPCVVYRTVRARQLWDQIMRASYDYAEPGVLFVDRINDWNNLWYREGISATNPCGEIPLPAFGACDLGSLNLTAFVREPFSRSAHFALDEFQGQVATAVRMLDNVIDVSQFPLPEQQTQALGTRRIGLGITGLADALIMLGVHYDSEQGRELAALWMRTLCHTAYRASIALARSRGSFPYLERAQYLQGRFIRSLPEDIRDDIARDGIRNSHLIAIAPTGTISLLADNISSGIEPVYAFELQRAVRGLDGDCRQLALSDYAWRLWRSRHGTAPVPDCFVAANEVSALAHLAMQAALQPYVDNAISKTINVPAGYDYAAFSELYHRAWQLGLKGCTTYRPNPVTGSLLTASGSVAEGSHCCGIDREGE